jgi:hypothetical protein
MLKHYYRRQHEAMLAYGGYVCACCGETEPLFLSIDHIECDGAEHRKKLGKSANGSGFYRWLRDNKYPPGFQVLCMNCNHGRMRNGGLCPHQEGATTIPKGSRVQAIGTRSAALHQPKVDDDIVCSASKDAAVPVAQRRNGRGLANFGEH